MAANLIEAGENHPVTPIEMNAYDLCALVDHIDALERQVKEAHEEGWCQALDNRMGSQNTIDKAWKVSKAKAAIANAQEGNDA